MAQYEREQLKKQEAGYAHNPLNSTPAAHDIGGTGPTMGMGAAPDCQEGKHGVVEKIQEKLPGGGDHGSDGHKTKEYDHNPPHSTPAAHDIGGTGTPNGMGPSHDCQEGKHGVGEKIKEKLPGGGDHGNDVHKTPATTTAVEGHEKKGMMEKIKEMLPGGTNQ